MHRRLFLAAALLCFLSANVRAQPAQPRCGDEERADEAAPASAIASPAAGEELRALVTQAIERNRGVGATRALAEAAARDVDETRAAAALQASLGANVGPQGSHSLGITSTQAMQGGATLSIGQLIWDGGRNAFLVDWRSQLAEAARLSLISQQEQIALSAVSLALDRSRYQAHERVFGQYVRKMACLVDSLQTIVAADRGRASELVQARKALQQAELSRVTAESQRRQAEIRLQRLLGEQPPAADGIGVLLQALPPVEPLLAQAERASEINQLAAQASAAGQFAKSVAAGMKPQLSWSVSGSRSLGLGGNLGTQHGGSVALGIAISVPLINPGVDSATQAAQARALAAREQLADAIEARRARVLEVHEQARSSLDRAERVRTVLRDSEQVRASTLLQWQQLGRRSLFDVMGAESEHYNLRVSWVNAVVDAQQLGATLRSLGPGLQTELPR